MQKFKLLWELKPISQIHGKVFDAEAWWYGDINPVKSASQSEAVSGTVRQFDRVKIVTLYHPAVALYQNSLKQQMFEDFKILKNFL